MKHTEILHGQHIISELLELLIDSNEIGMTLSEIEGDALLFYKQGELPVKNALAKQAQAMFTKFHQHLKKYESHRICECGACQSAGKLTLKIIAHAGVSNFITVKGQHKPYGQDIILAHRLLKNPIESSEYLLLSDSYLKLDSSELSTNDFPWAKLEPGTVEYESLGTVKYYYARLTPLHRVIPDVKPPPTFSISKPMKVEIYIERPRDEVFEIIIDLSQRMKWNKSANRIDFDSGELNQAGTKHVCVFDSNTIEFESLRADFGKRNLVYGEKVLDLPPFAKEITIYFIVSSEGSGSRVQQQVHFTLKPLIGWILWPIFRYKSRKLNEQALSHLKQYCEQTVAP